MNHQNRHHAPGDPGAPVRSGVPEHGRVPKYYAVKARLSLLVDELGEGGALPTERDLAVRYEVSRETVRQALRGGTPTLVKRYTADVVSRRETLTVPVPAGASNVSFRFRYAGSDNWYWTIDGVTVTPS